jgi:hypothetical protein
MILASIDASWWELTSDVSFVKFWLPYVGKIVKKKRFFPKSGFEFTIFYFFGISKVALYYAQTKALKIF